MPQFDVRITESAYQSIEDQVHHLAQFQPIESALLKLDTLIDTVTQRLENFPLASPISHQASLLGVTHYRELNTDGFRVFYEIIGDKVSVLLVMRHKQSVEEALVRYCLLKPLQ